jgi:hypothetical protein
MDIAQAKSFLHLWDWDVQVQQCERIVKLLCDRPGSVVLSRQVGDVEAGEYANATSDERVCGGTMSRLLGGCGKS